MNRGNFLLQSASWLTGVNLAWGADADDLLVVLFLRGGCDALNLLPPLSGDDRKIYEDERPNLKISTSGTGAAFKLNDKLGLHPSAKGLFELYQAKKLAIVQAAGMGSNNRSHFDAQEYMELGTPDRKGTGSGWLTRHLQSRTMVRTPASLNPLRTISVGALAPTSLLGCNETTSLVHPGHLGLAGGDDKLHEDMLSTMKSVYDGGRTWMHEHGRMALQTLEILGRAKMGDYNPPTEYPKNELGGRLKSLAQMIRLGLGVQLATVDMGGWDTHKYQGQGEDGTFAKQVDQLSQSIAAFYKDLAGQKLTVVIMSEFGRRLRENANRGTDHGHGGMMMVLGEHVHGGKVYGRWPGLKSEQLYERADLAMTTDFRTVLSEVLSKRCGEKKLNAIFPDFKMPGELGILS